MARGHLIVFEGGEGSGKSTQAEILSKRIGAELTREPGGTSLGEAIRPILLEHSRHELSDRAELLLMVAARAQHVVQRIAPALESGQDVVCDRFSGSTIAYQAYGRELPIEDVVVADLLATNGLRADLTVLLDLPRQIARNRVRENADRIESEPGEFHDRVLRGFRAQAEADPTGWAVIDGSGSRDEVARRVAEAVSSHLGARGQSIRL